jgi:DNA recombination protein RmuC
MSIYQILACVIAASLALLWYKSVLELKSISQKNTNLSADFAVSARLLSDREAILMELRTQLDTKASEILELHSKLSRAETQNETLQEQLKRNREELLQIQEQFRLEFEHLANRIFEQKSEKFTRQNQENLENLLKPLQEKIRDFEKKVEETYHSESRERFSLQKEVEKLSLLNQTLGREAANLTHALKGDTKTQGNWGEMILERVLELSGLRKDIHYLVQKSSLDEEGNNKRPDVILLLPGDRKLIIDSKVSLTAFEKYCSSGEEAEIQIALKEHLDSIRQHVSSLSVKDYPSLYRSASPDFVLMFIPLEPAFSLALQQDHALYEHAFRKNIILVSVFTLLATLRMIESMWRLDSQNKHAAEIVRQGSGLYEKFVGFVEDLKLIGKNIDLTNRSYESAIKKLSQGNDNLIRKAERMRLLGLDNKKQLPGDLTLNMEEDAEEELPPVL